MNLRTPERLIAVDPGAEHVGIAVWRKDEPILTNTLNAPYACSVISKLIAGSKSILILEQYVLYPKKAGAQAWQPMKTAEMIGALKWIAQGLAVPIIEQPATIKIPTTRQLKARGIKLARTNSNHARDAQLHLYHYLLQNDLD